MTSGLGVGEHMGNSCAIMTTDSCCLGGLGCCDAEQLPVCLRAYARHWKWFLLNMPHS